MSKIPVIIPSFKKENSISKSKLNNQLKRLKFNVPKQPYTTEAPNKNIPEMKEPETKYFKPASVEKDEFLLKLAKI